MFYQLLIAYGICFGIQNKLLFLRNRHSFLDALLNCTYCTGFHSGWITYSILVTDMDFIDCIAFAFASSAFSYAFDTLIRLMENHAGELAVQEEE